MAYKKPIIITNANSINEYVQDGINALIRKKTIEDYSSGIKQLMGDSSLRNALVENGYTIYKNKHSLKKLGESVGDIQKVIWRENEDSSNN